MIKYKQCIQCGIIKPLGLFEKQPSNIDNRSGKCSLCVKLRRIKTINQRENNQK